MKKKKSVPKAKNKTKETKDPGFEQDCEKTEEKKTEIQ